jgi:hypothetical protein
MTAVIVVAGQLPPELELEEPEPTAPYEQYRGVPTLMAGNSEAEQLIGPVSVA